MKTRTFLFACDKPTAVAWCKENGVKPYARTTLILTNRNPQNAHGFDIMPGDVCVFLNPSYDLLAELRPMLHRQVQR